MSSTPSFHSKYTVRLQAITCHWFFSIPRGNIRRTLIFWCFQGVQKETSIIKWVKTHPTLSTIKKPAKIYLFKGNNRNTIKKYEICSKLTIKTPERRQWRRSGVLTVNFEHISHLFLVFLLLILNK